MTVEEKRALLEIARRALVRAAEGRPEPVPDQLPAASIATGAFVTLRTRGKLRGCIGQTRSELPLADVVEHCTRAAALEDPRFKPVRPEELSGTEIEISVLSPPQEIARESIHIGEHGLIVSRGRLRGVLLPHVATEFGWPAQRFLEETCVKAGLEREAWKNPETKIQGFTAEVFSEREFATPSAANPSPTTYSSST